MRTKKIDVFMYCLIITAVLISLRLFENYPVELQVIAKSLTNMAEAAISAIGLSEFVRFLSTIPRVLMIFVVTFVIFLINIIFVFIFKKQISHAAVMVSHEISNVIISGLMIYTSTCIVLLMFVYSVVGLPIALIFLGITLFFILLGNIPLSIYIGELVQQMLGVKGKSIIVCFILGSFVMLLSNSVYSIGSSFLLFIYPVLSLGICFMCFYNRFIAKIKYKTDFDENLDKKYFDRDKMRDIICGKDN